MPWRSCSSKRTATGGYTVALPGLARAGGLIVAGEDGSGVRIGAGRALLDEPLPLLETAR
jgi:hypothetical protein